MALCSNGVTFFGTGIRRYGATAYLSAYPSAQHGDMRQAGPMRNLTAGEGITDELVGLPSGYRHPAAWMMPQKPGAISARNTLIGAGAAAATAQSGYNIDATIAGSGTIPGCDIGLIVSIAAVLTASGGISSAATEALAGLVATLTGSGDVTATASGLAALGAALTGAGSVSAGNTALMDITATIRGYSDLTLEGMRDAVWSAQSVLYNEAGTMGEKLNNAASAGDPWGTALPGAYAVGSAGYIVGTYLDAAVSAGGLSVDEAAQLFDVWQRLGLDPDNPMVTTATSIEAGGVTQAIDETAGPTITVTRAL